MKAVRMHAQEGPEAFVYEDAPKPEPQAGEVLTKVYAVAVTPTELLWPSTWKTMAGEPRSAPILGHEFSGVVSAVGAGVDNVKPGDEVYGLNGWFDNGAEAEYVLAQASQAALRPQSVGHVEASVVPISGLTAWQALIDRADLAGGQRVLIHGGAGGVGSFAIQIARWRGAHVITTASAYNLDFVRELGADEAIDYHTTRFEEVAKDVDVVLDTVGGETLERSKTVLKAGGKLYSVATDSKESGYFFYVEPKSDQLAELARLIDGGHLRAIVDEVMPLAQAREAYDRKPKRGKVVLQVSS